MRRLGAIHIRHCAREQRAYVVGIDMLHRRHGISFATSRRHPFGLFEQRQSYAIVISRRNFAPSHDKQTIFAQDIILRWGDHAVGANR